MVDMNGPLSSASGPGSVQAARSAAEEFGWSINGKRIEIVSADHQNKADIGAGIARQWFDFEHVDVIADLSQSAVGLAVVEIARPEKDCSRNRPWLVGRHRAGLQSRMTPNCSKFSSICRPSRSCGPIGALGPELRGPAVHRRREVLAAPAIGV